MLFTMKNNRMGADMHVCDLFADEEEILHGVSYTTAYNHVLLHAKGDDLYFEQDTECMDKPQTVREMRAGSGEA